MVDTPQEPNTAQDIERVAIKQPNAEDRALIEKHKSEIITLMDMDPAEQKVYFAAVGIDHDKIKDKPEYKNLQERNWQNNKDNEAAMKKVRNITLWAGITSFLGLGAASSLPIIRGRRLFDKGFGIPAIFTALLTSASTMIAYFFATKKYTKETASVGKMLSEEARDAYIIELARALGKRDIENAKSVIPVPSQPPMAATNTDNLITAGNAQRSQALKDIKTPSSSTVPPLASFKERIKSDADTAHLTTAR